MRSLLFLLLIVSSVALASDPYPKNKNIAVVHYTFALEVNDSTDVIAGEATITIRYVQSAASFDLNLISKAANGQGMEVLNITSSGKPVNYKHENDVIRISNETLPAVGDQRDYVVRYRGIPIDGFIISKNKFGDRTFFGDNWPDRGRNWLPSIDHPLYKAKVDFLITAPSHYGVVATGKLVEERELSKHRKLSHWQESAPVPVKVMTVGIARFSTTTSGTINGIPISTWVYPQNSADGFNDFAVGPKVFGYLQDYIGPFPYEKLAHVQSKTRWGGLENASNIFYFENSVNGKNEREGLIAHETAHQWFGNSASEADWHHVWLSEGFATYFTEIYMEGIYGRDKLMTDMTASRKSVFEFEKKRFAPIVDTTITDIGKVLSTNTYQKAGWFLHMLRKEIGDAKFKEGIRAYYKIYRDKNALTSDFRKVMESESGEDLGEFFHQWLYMPGHPKVKITWSIKRKSIHLDIEQLDGGQFVVPLELAIKDSAGTTSIQTIEIKPGKSGIDLKFGGSPLSIEADPGVWLLAETEVLKGN